LQDALRDSERPPTLEVATNQHGWLVRQCVLKVGQQIFPILNSE
jgi:hypothetical protein